MCVTAVAKEGEEWNIQKTETTAQAEFVTV
jgi:hypothetical protein